MIPIEIQQLINQLEEVFSQGWRLPGSQRLVVDEDACRRIIDQMRVSVPDLIKQAERTLGERDRIIAQANEEAGRIVQMAREQSAEIVGEDQITLAAQKRADEILVAAEREAATMRIESDEYAVHALHQLSAQLENIQREVDNGVHALMSAKTGESDS